MILQLKRQHLTLLREEARRVNPIEACALLFGNSTQKKTLVKKIVFAYNNLNSSIRFEIDPTFVIESFSEAEKAGMDLVSIFHSHPAPSKPSLVDLRYMKLWGDVLWLILSLTDNSLAAYQMIGEKAKKIQIKLIKTP